MSIKTLKTGATVLAFAALSPLAQADTHPLLSGAPRASHSTGLAAALEKAAPGQPTDLKTGGFIAKFQSRLAEPKSEPRIVWYPTKADLGGADVGQNHLVVGAVVPPAALYPTKAGKPSAAFPGNVPVCADQNGAVLYKGIIDAYTGKLTADTSPNPAPNPTASFRACKGWLDGKAQDMYKALDALAAETPPARVATTGPVVTP